MYCEKCGYKNDDAMKFCIKCGNALKKPNITYTDVPAVNGTTIMKDSTDTTYGEFGTLAKIWFGFCGVANIVAGIVNLISLIVLIFDGYGAGFFTSILAAMVGGLGIGIGTEYILLIIHREKKTAGSLFVTVATMVVFNFIYMCMTTGVFGGVIAIISGAIHIGILYVILSKYDGDATNVNPLNVGSVPADSSAFGSKCCPKCGGNHLQVINESRTSGGGFSATNGCCGYILLGPLGILCGACGSKTKTVNKTFFVCMDCGNKFAK